jgi:hypothetical protein
LHLKSQTQINAIESAKEDPNYQADFASLILRRSERLKPKAAPAPRIGSGPGTAVVVKAVEENTGVNPLLRLKKMLELIEVPRFRPAGISKERL